LPIALPIWTKAEPTLDSLEADLLALIADPENAQGYQTCSQHWTKAHIAGQLREVMSMDVPPCVARLSISPRPSMGLAFVAVFGRPFALSGITVQVSMKDEDRPDSERSWPKLTDSDKSQVLSGV
jgi:hypothetical protein